MMRFATLIPAFALCACATAPDPGPSAPETRAQALAALLIATEAADPRRVAAAAPEMAALEAVLAPSPPARAQLAPAPAPDVAAGRSVLSAVHVASYRDRTTAGRGWTQLAARHEALAGRSPRVQRVDLGARGVFLRLKAGPYDTPGAAETACAQVRAAGGWCAVTDFAGEAL